KYLRNCLNELGIETKLSSTGTRHTYASYLLSQGVDIWVISKILGHKDVTQLMETYGHLLKEKQDSEFELTRILVDR
ncbi:tyrosine-type recombinase/integrase, partial [Streptococcus pluranimalium]|uniref:tyrosine-type recombinase/integrase n=1 Tax=Streptococcus pluranimalium TaxID=82348 RepID=UPI003BF8EC15